MKSFCSKLVIAALLACSAATLTVKADYVYNNSTTDTGNTLLFTNGWTIGNEIILGGNLTSATITKFSFEIYSPNTTFSGSSVTMSVFLFANDGPGFNGYLTPSTVLFSNSFTLPTPYSFPGNGNQLVGTVNFDLTASPVSVTSSNFTFAAVVTGLAAGDTVGYELFSPPSVGSAYGDYWVNDGSGWVLKNGASPTLIGARFEAAPVPEPSTLALLVVGGGLLVALRRRIKQS